MFVPKGTIDAKSALVQVMTWCQISDEPLPETMVAKFNDICVYASLGLSELNRKCNIYYRSFVSLWALKVIHIYICI